MDLVLFIIILCFRGSSEYHSYTALSVLSTIGLAATFIGGFFNWLLFLDAAWYLLNLILCGTAGNRV